MVTDIPGLQLGAAAGAVRKALRQRSEAVRGLTRSLTNRQGAPGLACCGPGPSREGHQHSEGQQVSAGLLQGAADPHEDR